MWPQTVNQASVCIQSIHAYIFIDEKMVYLLWHEVLWMICNMSWIFGWNSCLTPGKEEREGVWLFYYPKIVVFLLLLNFKFLSVPRRHFFFCVVKKMFLTWPCIFCIGSPTFLQKEKKNQKSTCLNKKISMFKAVCCCDLIKNVFSLCLPVLLADCRIY